MICNHCQTTLPDQAVACWKCGAPVAAAVLPPEPLTAPQAKKREPDLLYVILTFVITAGFFVCAGWAVPFTVWGLIIGSAKQFPALTGLLDIISGIAFILSTFGFFAGVWWGAYKISLRLAR